MMSTDRFRSVSKTIAILNCFDSQNLKLSSSEIAKKLGIHRATALRMLEFLSEAQWIEKYQDSHKYSIGPALHMLGSLYLGTTDILKASESVIKAINELTNEEIQVGIFNKGNIVFILKEETKRAFGFVQHRVGTVLPAYTSAMGLAILSELSEKEIDDLYPCEQLIPLTKYTINNKTDLKQELKKIRKSGFSISKEASWEGAVGIGSVIRNYSGRTVAATSIGLPVHRVNDSVLELFSTVVRMAASLISYRLGYLNSGQIHDIRELRDWWQKNKPRTAS